MTQPTFSAQSITAGLLDQIQAFQPPAFTVHTVEVLIPTGVVIGFSDGIATVKPNKVGEVGFEALVQFSTSVQGMVLGLDEEKIQVVVLGSSEGIVPGSEVYSLGKIASVPVGDALLSRVVDVLGRPLDNKGPIKTTASRPMEKIAAGIIERKDVDTPVQTGIKAIDAMTPIGRGQRELIIGDRGTGKTALAIDTIINQKGKNLICIYVAIGQKKSSIARLIATLESYGAMEYTVIVVGSADDPAGLQYLAPYAGCAIGEEFMERGQDVLIVYDDLTKHAWAYRQVSLLLRRPPAREAYPGDIFYLHSRLLERAVRLADKYVIVTVDFVGNLAEQGDAVNGFTYDGPLAKHKADTALKQLDHPDMYRVCKLRGSGGSLTALPIIETQLGDVSAYIPTNVISITDGQIYLEGNLGAAGIWPAINVGLSVSRVGGDAQIPAMKKIAGPVRMDMAQFRELQAFAQLGQDLDKSTQGQIDRGRRLQEILKQPQYQPVPVEEQVVILYAGTHGYADKIGVSKVKEWERELLKYMQKKFSAILRKISEEKRLSPELEAELNAALQNFQFEE